MGVEDPVRDGVENRLVKRRRVQEDVVPVLAPFQLAGPDGDLNLGCSRYEDFSAVTDQMMIS
ncbi:hypothetical protein AKJ16_DCAP11930 [Drosera capensis]